jgi:hypothetical protein
MSPRQRLSRPTVAALAIGALVGAGVAARPSGTVEGVTPGPTGVTLRTARIAGPGVVLEPGTSASAYATCPGGAVVTGGGHFFRAHGSERPGLTVSASVSSHPHQGWIVAADNPTDQPVRLTAFAICARAEASGS